MSFLVVQGKLRMSKTKIRCNTCGKWFQSANAKEVTCPDCLQKARKEKMAAKAAPPSAGKTAPGTEAQARSVPPPPKPKPAAGGTSHWLDTQGDVKVAQPDQSTRPKIPSSPAPRDNRGAPERDRGSYQSTGPGGYRDRDERGPGGPGGYREGNYRSPGGYRGPAPYRVGGGMGIPDTDTQRPRQPMPGPGGPRGPRPSGPGEQRPDKRRDDKPADQKQKTPKPKPVTPPKPKREKIPPPAPFKPTEEQIAQVEARYQELAVPTEFDGIRTQISKELGIPKTAVKKIIKDFREKQDIPSWWDLQTFKGNEEELAKIKEAYIPHLPLPPVGIHKQFAEALSLKPGDVYQAIKTIRLEMNLPQYNDPALHGLELRPEKKEKTEPETQDKETAQASETQDKETTTSGEAPKQETPAASAAPEQESSSAGEAPKQETPAASAASEQESSSAGEAPKQETPTASAASEQEIPANELEKQTPEGQISSIETDMTLHKEGDTLEVTDASPEKEGETAKPVATAPSETRSEGEA